MDTWNMLGIGFSMTMELVDCCTFSQWKITMHKFRVISAHASFCTNSHSHFPFPLPIPIPVFVLSCFPFSVFPFGPYHTIELLYTYSDINECLSKNCCIEQPYDKCTSVFLLLIAVNCGSLSNPSNGRVSHTAGTTYQQTATYSCNTGYNLVGSSTRMCQATGVWSGSAPTCQSMYMLQMQLHCSECAQTLFEVLGNNHACSYMMYSFGVNSGFLAVPALLLHWWS